MKKLAKSLVALVVIVVAFSSCIVRERSYGGHPRYYHEHRDHGYRY